MAAPDLSGKRISDTMSALSPQRAGLLEQQDSGSASTRRIAGAVSTLNAGSAASTEWDEGVIRQLVDTVQALPADRIRAYLRGGTELEQTIGEERPS